MKRIILAFFLLITSLQSTAQCTAPELVEWNFISDDELQIIFIVSESATSYSILGTSVVNENTHTYSDTTLNNTMNITIDPGLIFEQYWSWNVLNTYFVFYLTTICDGIQSEPTKFYVTFHSLYNQMDISCNGHYIEPYLAIPDNSWFSADIEVPPGVTNSITSITLLIEMHSSFLADLNVKLESPSGTQIYLMAGNFGGAQGMSVLFDDTATPINEVNYTTPNNTIMGVIAPMESFEAFYGETVSGTWKILIQNNWLLYSHELYSVCLSFGTTPCTASLNGKVYFDSNSNSVQDTLEPAFVNAVLSNSLSPFPFFNTSNGTFARCSPEGNMELEMLNVPLYYVVNPQSYSDSLFYGDALENLDFALQPIPGIIDLTIDLWTVSNFIPGFQAVYQIDYANIGTECQENVEIEVLIDPILNILSSNAPNYTQNNNVILLNLSTLCPFESGSFTITVSVPADVSLGVSVSSFAEINPFEGDEDTSNNQDELNIGVIGSYDPNDKQVNHEIIYPEFQDDQKYLEYLIRFQNTGTFYAQNVVVTDTLSQLLNPATFVMLNNSHPVEVQFEDNTLHFIFNDIMLPDSTTNEPESHGYVRFKIKPYQNIALGSVIENTANIYFDFNEPIITNTTQTFYTLPTNVSYAAEGLNINIYPNPARDQITVVWGSFKPHWLEILDISGRVVSQNNVSQSEEQTILNIASMPAGLYFLRLSSAQTQSIARWVKQ